MTMMFLVRQMYTHDKVQVGQHALSFLISFILLRVDTLIREVHAGSKGGAGAKGGSGAFSW